MNEAQTLDVLALAYALLDGAPWFHGLLPAKGHAECAITALKRAFLERSRLQDDATWIALRRLVESGLPAPYVTLGLYNDAPGRRKRDALRLFLRAAAKVGKG
jgi:hypothetical protein